MKLQVFLDQIKNHKGYIQALDKSYDGACPCFNLTKIIDGYRVKIHGHCWRICRECTYNGLHLTSKMPRKDLMKIAKVLKKDLDAQKWYSPYEVKIISLKG